MTASSAGNQSAQGDHNDDGESSDKPAPRVSRGNRLRDRLRLAARIGTIALVLIRLYVAARDSWTGL